MNRLRVFQKHLLFSTRYRFCTKSKMDIEPASNKHNEIDLTRRPKSRKNIKEYIKAAKKNAGQEHEEIMKMGKGIKITSEEGVNWLLEKFIRPNMQKELLSEDGMRRKELIDQGILPKDVLERLKFGEIVRAQIMKENPGFHLSSNKADRIFFSSLSQIVSSYSKLQLGSVEFFSALEKYIIEYAGHPKDSSYDVIQRKSGSTDLSQTRNAFKMKELSSIMYSFAVNPNCSKRIIDDLTPIVLNKIQTMKGDEVGFLSIILKAYDRTGKFKGELVTAFEKAFIANFEMMKPEDISDFYYCFTNVLCSKDERTNKVVGSPKFYNYIQKCISRLIGGFTGSDIKKIFHEYNNPNNQLYAGKSKASIRQKIKRHLIYLISKKEITNHDLYEIMKYTEIKNEDDQNNVQDKDDERFKEIRQIITDIKKGNSTSTQWFEAVERIQKEKLYIVKLFIQ